MISFQYDSGAVGYGAAATPSGLNAATPPYGTAAVTPTFYATSGEAIPSGGGISKGAVIGAAVGAGVGAASAKLGHVGIDDEFIDRVKSAVTEGTSALFLLSSSGVADRIQQRFIGAKPELIATNLGPDEEARLREAFGEE